jgi:hypothetical protein
MFLTAREAINGLRCPRAPRPVEGDGHRADPHVELADGTAVQVGGQKRNLTREAMSYMLGTDYNMVK